MTEHVLTLEQRIDAAERYIADEIKYEREVNKLKGGGDNRCLGVIAALSDVRDCLRGTRP